MWLRKEFIKKYAEKLPEGLVPVLILFSAVVYLFSFIEHEVIREQEENVDNNILKYFSDHVINERMTAIMKVLTYMGSAPFLQVGYGLLMIRYLLPKNYKRALEVLAIGVSGLLINLVMKYSFHRPRPSHPLIAPLQSFSFPSGHATSGFIFYGLLVYLIWKTKTLPKSYKYTAGAVLISLSLLIGYSRVYLRLHYPSDVAAGFCVGFAWLLILISLMEFLKKKSDLEVIEEKVLK